jgi:hypothetical protein
MIPIITAPNAKQQGTTEESSSSSSLVRVGDTLEVLEFDEERLAEWKRLFDP